MYIKVSFVLDDSGGHVASNNVGPHLLLVSLGGVRSDELAKQAVCLLHKIKGYRSDDMNTHVRVMQNN